MRVIIAAGGTAGHVFPGLAVAGRLRNRFEADVAFVGTAGGQETTLVPAAGFTLFTVKARPFVRGLSLAALAAPVHAVRAAARCRPLVADASVAVGMGGYASVPVALAARRTRVPLVVHEQNAVPGLANRLASRWARTVALSFPQPASQPHRGLSPRADRVVTGNPVRERIIEVPSRRAALAEEAREAFGLVADRTTVVVFGGSQGALRLDRATVGALPRLAGRDDLQFLLITGPAHHGEVTRAMPPGGSLLVRAVPFVERMEWVYAAADLAVARAGATTVAELAVCAVPALLVPYPYATGRHQEANARAMERAGGASVLLDDQVDQESLAERIVELVDHPERMEAMRRGSASFGRPDAADALADAIAEAAG